MSCVITEITAIFKVDVNNIKLFQLGNVLS